MCVHSTNLNIWTPNEHLNLYFIAMRHVFINPKYVFSRFVEITHTQSVEEEEIDLRRKTDGILKQILHCHCWLSMIFHLIFSECVNGNRHILKFSGIFWNVNVSHRSFKQFCTFKHRTFKQIVSFWILESKHFRFSEKKKHNLKNDMDELIQFIIRRSHVKWSEEKEEKKNWKYYDGHYYSSRHILYIVLRIMHFGSNLYEEIYILNYIILWWRRSLTFKRMRHSYKYTISIHTF